MPSSGIISQTIKTQHRPRLRFLLRRLEEDERVMKRHKSGNELKPGKLSLEHILPRNPSEEWADVLTEDPEVVKECGERLGNLCLIGEARNRDLGLQSFDKKRPVFAESDVVTTKVLADTKEWRRKDIEHRQAYMASRARSYLEVQWMKSG
jgi:hypothetical protein